MNKQLERISSGDNPEMILVRTNTRDVKVNILPLYKKLIKHILKRRVKNRKKFTIFKIIRFRAYRPIIIINNDSEKDV